MNSLKQRLRNWLNSDDYERNVIHQTMAVSKSTSLDCDRGIRFQVYKAQGGTVIETGFYDRIKDRHLNSLHVITDDQDLGNAIGKIITMETMKL
jgi:hypothetical protein